MGVQTKLARVSEKADNDFEPTQFDTLRKVLSSETTFLIR